MRILMIIDRMDCGGAETHLLELSAELVARGHRVCVVSSGGALADELVRRGVFHVCMPISKVGAFISVRRICRLTRIWNFDVIHSHSRVASFIADTVSKKMGICFVSTAHARFSLKGFRRKLSRWGRKSIAVSDDLKEYLTQNYDISPENVEVIPNGVNSSRFCPDTRERNGRTRIVFLSRLDAECSVGAFLLCDIARELTENFGNIEIVIGGGGDALERVQKRAREVNSAIGFECIKTVGRVDDVPSFLRGADIFVGVSRAAIEASFCGASVVLCGDEGFLGELREENFSLAMVSNFCARGQREASAEQLYAEISRLLKQDFSAREAKAFKIRERMLGECELGVTVEKTENFYRQALTVSEKECAEVVLCGYYGFGNIGDEALLQAALERAKREFPNARIAVIFHSDGERFGIRCIARKNVREVLNVIKKCKYFVFGGGTLLQDSTSRRSLLYYASLLSLAKKGGAKCCLWGNGIGEPRRKKSEKMIADALMGCEYIGLRDARSVDIAKRLLGEDSRIVFERDLAEAEQTFFLSGEKREEVLPDGQFVIVALKGKRCPMELDECIKREKEKGRSLVFVAMFPSQDLKISRKYCKKYSGILKSDIDFSDLVCIARNSAGVYSMRLHALVAAKIANTPFRGFGDSKVTEFGS